MWNKTYTYQNAPKEILALGLVNDGFGAPRTILAIKQYNGKEALAAILYKKENRDEVLGVVGEYRVMWLSPPAFSPFVPAIFPGFGGHSYEPDEGVVPAQPNPEFTYWGFKMWGEYRVLMQGATIDLNDGALQIIRGMLRQDIAGLSKFSGPAPNNSLQPTARTRRLSKSPCQLSLGL